MGDAIETTAPREGQEVTAREESTREFERYATPPVDIYETDDGLIVLADLPGVFQLTVDSGDLSGGVHPITRSDSRHVRGNRCGHIGKLESKFPQPGLNLAHGVF